jgi:hypothetical protein
MIYNADLTIGNDSFMFSTYTFKKYCDKRGIELEGLYELMAQGTAFKSKDLPELLLTANETWCLYNNKKFEANELKAYSWIDQLGGFNDLRIVEVYKTFASKLLNVEKKQLDVIAEDVNPKNVNGQEVVSV